MCLDVWRRELGTRGLERGVQAQRRLPSCCPCSFPLEEGAAVRPRSDPYGAEQLPTLVPAALAERTTSQGGSASVTPGSNPVPQQLKLVHKQPNFLTFRLGTLKRVLHSPWAVTVGLRPPLPTRGDLLMSTPYCVLPFPSSPPGSPGITSQICHLPPILALPRLCGAHLRQ